MSVDHLLEKYKVILRDKLRRNGELRVDKSLYNDARDYMCLQKRRVDKAINEMADDGELAVGWRKDSAYPMVLMPLPGLKSEAGE